MVSLGSVFGGMGGWIGTSIRWLLYIIPAIIIVFLIGYWIRQRIIFKYKVRIFRTRENGKVKEVNCKAGYIGRKNSAPFFRIKLGRWWWQIVDLIETPKVEYMDEDDRVYYKQIDVSTYVQLKRKIEAGTISFTPVESDVKYGAILSVQRIKDVLRTEPTWKKVLPYAGLIILAIVFIVSYAMLMNRCSA